MEIETAQLQRQLLDHRLPTRTFDGPQDGVVTRASATQCWVTISIDGLDNVEYGPAPYPRPALHPVTVSPSSGTLSPNPHSHDVGTPPKGTRCLVTFVGSGVDRPRVVAFYGWPT